MKRSPWVGVLCGAIAVGVFASYGCDAPVDPGPPIEHILRVTGPVEDQPLLPKLFIRTRPGADAPWGERVAPAFGPDGSVQLEAVAGAEYELFSELEPSDAMRTVFWMIAAAGTLPPAGVELAVPMPPRTRVRLLTGGSPNGVDILTVYDEATGTGGWALNNPEKNLYEGFGRGNDTNAYQRIALQRPIVIDTFRPGKYVVAARVNGRQWTARRMELEPNALLDYDAGRAPAGGGRVVCENGDAVLLLNGDLPIPMPYERTDFRYRCQWEGVPPGEHAVRYPGGTVKPITVEDGKETRLPK